MRAGDSGAGWEERLLAVPVGTANGVRGLRHRADDKVPLPVPVESCLMLVHRDGEQVLGSGDDLELPQDYNLVPESSDEVLTRATSFPALQGRDLDTHQR